MMERSDAVEAGLTLDAVGAYRARMFKLPQRTSIIGYCVALLVLAPCLLGQQIPVVERTLPNGMRLLMVERRAEPTIAAGWVAHVGSVNERPGITGIAHLFEHMMFKGTPNIGTKDAARDRQIIAEQERVRELMRQEEKKMRSAWRRGEIDDLMKPENATPQWRELKQQFDKLIAEQRALMVKDEFDLVYTTAGGSGLNAFTDHDETVYFITVPSNKLELWMWMESDRLLQPVFREFYSERDVVMEERRLRTESTPTGKAEEAFEAMFWGGHPYAWPVIGWPSDVPAITKAQADEFYATYYSPQNITLVLVGDFNTDEAERLANRYFARIPRGKNDPPEVLTVDPAHPVEKRLNAEVDANPEVTILWRTVPFQHRDSYPLQVLSRLCVGRTGRLHKAMVLEGKLATQVSAYQSSERWGGAFAISAEARDGRTLAECEQAIYAQIARLASEDVPADELQKVKNQFAAAEYRRLSGNMAIFMNLIRNEAKGDWRETNEAGAKIQAVTSADIRRVARQYFTPQNRSVAHLTRKPGSARSAPTTQPARSAAH